MEESCPPTPLISMPGRNSKSPNPITASSPDSDEMKSPNGRHSPDSRCVICLGKLHKKSFTDSCLHQFCFNCLLQWSKVKPECPLCKQPFKSIIHNVRSNFDYDQYYIERRDPAFVVSEFFRAYDINLMPVDRRFRYRSTMTREYFRELAESFLSRSGNPYHLPGFLPATYLPSVSGMGRTRAERQRYRNGLEFRRSVYARDVWVQDFEHITGRYRECSPQFFRENPAQVHRIIPWLNREICALVGENDAHCGYILDRIVSMLTQHSIISNEFRNSIITHFGTRTDHFVHEFYTFARSVYDMSGFDCHASYTSNPNYVSEVQEISSSSCDSEVEVITSVNEERASGGSFSNRLRVKKDSRNDSQSINSGEPVPGPSGINNPQPEETVDVGGSDSDDVKVIDYVKPKPIVIILNSSDEETRDSFSNQDRQNNSYELLCSKEKQEEASNEMDKNINSDKKYKTVKGKCKSSGVDLKGEQKKDYMQSKVKRSPSSSSSCSGISDVSSTSSGSFSSIISSIDKTPINFTSSSASTESITSEKGSSNSENRRYKKNITSKTKEAGSNRGGNEDACAGRKAKIGRKRKLTDTREAIKKSKRIAQSVNSIKEGAANDVAKTNSRKGKVKSCVVVPKEKPAKSAAKLTENEPRDNSDDILGRSYSSSSACSNSVQSVEFPLLPPPPPPSYWSIVLNNQHKKSKKEKHVKEKVSRSKDDPQDNRSGKRRKRSKINTIDDGTSSDSSIADSVVDNGEDGSAHENSKRAKHSLSTSKCATLDETKTDHHHHHHHHHQLAQSNKK